MKNRKFGLQIYNFTIQGNAELVGESLLNGKRSQFASRKQAMVEGFHMDGDHCGMRGGPVYVQNILTAHDYCPYTVDMGPTGTEPAYGRTKMFQC